MAQGLWVEKIAARRILSNLGAGHPVKRASAIPRSTEIPVLRITFLVCSVLFHSVHFQEKESLKVEVETITKRLHAVEGELENADQETTQVH